jgi:glycosyltransferase involved in cell wall biosynthesis
MEWIPEQMGIQPLFVPELQREISLAADLPAALRLRKLITDLRPDILHTHTAKAGAVGRIAAAIAGRARPRVIVHTFHGHVLRGYFSAPKTALFGQLERNLARMSDALIAVSPQVRDDLVKLGVAPAEKITVVRLGLDLEARTRSSPADRAELRDRLGLAADRFLVGWLGRMTEIKRTDLLLRAFARLRETHQADLLLVGDGPLRRELEALAGDLGISDSCHFIGYRDDVGPVFAAVDAVALTSANEGTPVTLIEALAAGRPVVSTDVGGVRDVVGPETGFLVPAGDFAAVAESLRRLADDPALRQTLGNAGRASVLERYSVPRLVDDVDLLYRTLLETAGTTTRAREGLSEALPSTLTRPPRRLTAHEPRLKVTMVSQYFPPEIGATQSRMQSFAEYLAERGHDVTVVCEFPNHPHGIIPERYRGRLVDDDRSNPYRVLRVWVQASHEKTQRTRLAFYLSYMAMATAVTPLTGRPDVVVATSPPLFAGAAGYAISLLTRAPLVLDVRDLWPAAAVSLGQISTGITLRCAELAERLLYRNAAAVVAVTRPFCDHVDAIRGRGPATAFIPNGTLDMFISQNGGVPRSELGLDDDRFVVTFAGLHGIAQALPSVLDAAELADGRAHFSFVGEGPIKEALVEDARARGLGNVSFHPQVPLERILPVLSASDALLVPLSSHPTFETFVPSKMIDYLATGRPVILSASGEAVRVLEQSGGGVAVPPEDPHALADAVRRLADSPAEAAEMGRRGKAFARTRLRSAQAERLEQILFSLVPETRGAR